MSERERNRNHNHNNRDRDRERDRDRDRDRNRERDREREGDRDREGDRERDRDRRGRRRHFEFRPRGGGKRIPDRWLNYNGMGIRVHGTRFLPFKTPLHTHICENSKLGAKSFDIQSILQSCKEDGNRIGLVIDLTNTDKYYNSSDWARNGIEYIKLRCPGHEVHEREDVVKEFNRIVDSFLKIREDHDLIGVHCTHGINRTGYLICRYLIEREKWTAQQAIESFEFARGYTIERPQYKVKLAAVEKELGLIKDTAGDSEVVSSDEKLQTRMETSEEGASSRMETSEEGASSRIEQSHDEDVGKSC